MHQKNISLAELWIRKGLFRIKVGSDFHFEPSLIVPLKGTVFDFDFHLFSYTRRPSFMPPIHFWGNSSSISNQFVARSDGGTKLDKTEHRGVIPPANPDLKNGVSITLEIWGVKTTLSTLCMLMFVCLQGILRLRNNASCYSPSMQCRNLFHLMLFSLWRDLNQFFNHNSSRLSESC